MEAFILYRIVIRVSFDDSKYFPEHKLPENVIATTDAKAALLNADYCLHAVPVQVFCFRINCIMFAMTDW